MDPLAQRLRSERERQGLSIKDLSVVTKIREPYIDALERGRYDVLPTVYVRSFVRTLAQAMAIPIAEVNKLMDEVFDLDGEVHQPERLPRSEPPEPEKPAVLAETVQSAGKFAAAGAQKASALLGDSFERLKGISLPAPLSGNPRLLMMIGGGIGLLLGCCDRLVGIQRFI